MTGADAGADSLSCATGNATHGDVYAKALKDDLIDTIRDSEGPNFQSFQVVAVGVDDLCPMTDRNYTSILFTGRNRLGFDSAACCRGHQDRKPAKRGQRWRAEILHSRVNLAIHPAGFQWSEGSVVGDSSTIAELGAAANVNRIVERKGRWPGVLSCPSNVSVAVSTQTMPADFDLSAAHWYAHRTGDCWCGRHRPT
ncbi:hypothetical protein [uncultured Marivita sp.]|uniref:hypothetical protein n=1 Tax=uncultured Marivita sp. TaxID=888080 RepID=UPI0026314F65|nr:hypothetical protein [uncultured Marivita sp.]